MVWKNMLIDSVLKRNRCLCMYIKIHAQTQYGLPEKYFTQVFNHPLNNNIVDSFIAELSIG